MKWLTIENEFGITAKDETKKEKMMYTESKNGTKKLTTYQLTLTAVMAAVICVLGPISIAIPVSPVPISLASMAVYLAVTVLGMKLGTLSCLIYLLLGLVGIPVFAGGSAGAAKLFGPTGGYLIGYLFLALIAGAFVGRFAENKEKYRVCGIGHDSRNHRTVCAWHSLAGILRRHGFSGGSVGRRYPVYSGRSGENGHRGTAGKRSPGKTAPGRGC